MSKIDWFGDLLDLALSVVWLLQGFGREPTFQDYYATIVLVSVSLILGALDPTKHPIVPMTWWLCYTFSSFFYFSEWFLFLYYSPINWISGRKKKKKLVFLPNQTSQSIGLFFEKGFIFTWDIEIGGDHIPPLMTYCSSNHWKLVSYLSLTSEPNTHLSQTYLLQWSDVQCWVFRSPNGYRVFYICMQIILYYIYI